MSLDLARESVPRWFPPDAELERWLALHQPVYRWRRPRYLVRQLKDLALLLPPGDCRVLDVGGGSGLVGETIARFFPGKSVAAIDVVDRFLRGLTIEHTTFDGWRIPHADATFDCALFSNVLHHVPLGLRAPLLAEALRVTGGRSVVIKDHLAASALDRARLAALDFVGNLPFGGMVWAQYLSQAHWRQLFAEAGAAAELTASSGYRSGVAAAAFPNRIEVLFRVRSSKLAPS